MFSFVLLTKTECLRRKFLLYFMSIYYSKEQKWNPLLEHHIIIQNQSSNVWFCSLAVRATLRGCACWGSIWGRGGAPVLRALQLPRLCWLTCTLVGMTNSQASVKERRRKWKPKEAMGQSDIYQALVTVISEAYHGLPLSIPYLVFSICLRGMYTRAVWMFSILFEHLGYLRSFSG